MPPSSGKAEESWMTARPCGMKNSAAARSHRASVPGPAFAAVATQGSPTTATRLNRTRSRSVRPGSSPTGFGFVMRVLPGPLYQFEPERQSAFDYWRSRLPTPSRLKRSRMSAGLTIFRKRKETIDVLLVRPGRPFFRNKDFGAWTIPKGEAGEEEDLQTRAAVEFQEELGIAPPANEAWINLGSIKQKGGKTVHGWAAEA